MIQSLNVVKIALKYSHSDIDVVDPLTEKILNKTKTILFSMSTSNENWRLYFRK